MKQATPVWLRIYGAGRAIEPQRFTAPADSAGADGSRPVPLHISWEEALLRLEKLPRMFVEPDGSFLWTGEATAEAAQWRLEGTVYDDGQVVRYIELRGQCPLRQWQEFLGAFDESFSTVVLDLLDQSTVVEGEWLRRRVAGERSMGEG